jgi:hypothetical protein
MSGNYSHINEEWNPGPRPDPREAAVILIGENAVRRIEDAGMSFQTHYWPVTREAMDAALAGRDWEPCPTEESKRARLRAVT